MTTRAAAIILLVFLAGVQLAGQAYRSDTATVTVLPDDLAARPRKGLGYLPSKALRTNASGDIEAVAGADNDCVKVNGQAGECGGGGSRTFIYGEVPSGLVNGTNNAFSLAVIPGNGTLRVYRNGVRLKETLDYTLSGTAITFVVGAIPQTGDVLLADYDY